MKNRTDRDGHLDLVNPLLPLYLAIGPHVTIRYILVLCGLVAWEIIKEGLKLSYVASGFKKLRPRLPNINWTGRGSIGPYEIYGGLKRMTWVDGVNSELDTGEHILLWDFDEAELERLVADLKEIVKRYRLGPVHVIQTGEGRYHAYCFTALSWRTAFNLVWATPGVDLNYVKFGFMRGYFTLRMSEKSGRGFTPVALIDSYVTPDVDPKNVRNFVNYRTKAG